MDIFTLECNYNVKDVGIRLCILTITFILSLPSSVCSIPSLHPFTLCCVVKHFFNVCLLWACSCKILWGGGGVRQPHQSDEVMLSVIPCAEAFIECFLCSFREWSAVLKLKHAPWFAAVIGKMQFSPHGRQAHLYSGISECSTNRKGSKD